jgi:hypothetical protein
LIYLKQAIDRYSNFKWITSRGLALSGAVVFGTPNLANAQNCDGNCNQQGNGIRVVRRGLSLVRVSPFRRSATVSIG